MDSSLFSKLDIKTEAERPLSRDGLAHYSRKSNRVVTGFCKLPENSSKLHRSHEKTTYSAHLRKPNTKEEILILLCIINKSIKLLCRYNQSRLDKCKTPDYNKIYYFIDIGKRLDKFRESITSMQCENCGDGLSCYSKLLNELKSIKKCIAKEIESNYSVYKCKIDLIECLMACFRSIENKIYCLMVESDRRLVPEDRDVSRLGDIATVKTSFCPDQNASSRKSSSSSCCKKSILSKCSKRSVAIECCLQPEPKECSPKSRDRNNVSVGSQCCPKSETGDSCPKSVTIDCCPKSVSKECCDNTKAADCCDNTMTKQESCLRRGCKTVDEQCSKSSKSQNEIFDITLEYCRYICNSESSSSDGEEDCFEQVLSDGYIKSKIFKKDDTVSLSVKCVTKGKESAILDLDKKCESSGNTEKLKKISLDMTKLLCMSKQWYDSGKEVYHQILNR